MPGMFPNGNTPRVRALSEPMGLEHYQRHYQSHDQTRAIGVRALSTIRATGVRALLRLETKMSAERM